MISFTCACKQVKHRSNILVSSFLKRQLGPTVNNVQFIRGNKDDSSPGLSSLIHPVRVEPTPDDINIGAELSGHIRNDKIIPILTKFAETPQVHTLASEYGLDDKLIVAAIKEFRQYCIESEVLPTDLHITLTDIAHGAGCITDIFPFFIRHSKQIFPHIECIGDLKKIGDLRSPASWYPQARAKKRKIIFHSGPTNSGKTYHALERFMSASSGVYCGPLKLLAAEVYQKCNHKGTPCDLVTGEEKKFATGKNEPSPHISCSMEMANVSHSCQVAVLDEIQMMRDPGRGWAWTRALLGIPADEIHLCGEAAALDLVCSLCMLTGETVEVRNYKRLTKLVVASEAVNSLDNIQQGDCIVCFNKNDIFTISYALESKGVDVAVIYGSLPPGTKLAQAAKFNDPDHPCKVMVATNAIGMGLNLHIRRVVFYSVMSPITTETGEKELTTISVSAALQIAGRAGRYGTAYETGYVTTFHSKDLPTLKDLLNQTPEPIAQAGLQPTCDQIQLYAYHLPNEPLSTLIDIFISLCTVDDSLFFMCDLTDFKFLADMIQHIPLSLRQRYIFCCAPINKKIPFVCTMFLKFARQYSKNDVVSFNWLCQLIKWPFKSPKTLMDLVHLENVFDVLDLYLWLSYRFLFEFPDADLVRGIQKELDQLIQDGIYNLSAMLSASEATSGESNNEQPKLHIKKKDRKTFIQFVEKGTLTKRLLNEGLLTPAILRELQNEWQDDKKKK